jgi:hypothetical protein
MKTRKLSHKQINFLSDVSDSMQWSKVTTTTHQKIEHLLSQLLLSIISHTQSTIKAERHANKN